MVLAGGGEGSLARLEAEGSEDPRLADHLHQFFLVLLFILLYLPYMVFSMFLWPMVLQIKCSYLVKA